MTRVVYLASPLSGDVWANLDYAKAAMRHSLSIGESPFAPHLIYPLVLDDTIPAEREAGMRAGAAFIPLCDALVAYVDRGISRGMASEIEQAKQLGIPVDLRRIANGLTLTAAHASLPETREIERRGSGMLRSDDPLWIAADEAAHIAQEEV